MHYHCEIVIPPDYAVETAIADILRPFDENNEDGYSQFWDWYVIGGRWAGEKTRASLDQDKLNEFYTWMTAEKVMVKGLVAGKETLADDATVGKVDARWREMFPGKGDKCILFSHSNDQYHEALPQDVCRLGEVPEGLTASRVIIAGPHWQDPDKLEAKHMVETEHWNGVSHVKSEWDGTLQAALAKHIGGLTRAKAEYRNKNTPTDDWLVVTVDYHS